jgi:hypothetical protein
MKVVLLATFTLIAISGCAESPTSVSITHTNAMRAYTYELRLVEKPGGVAVATVHSWTESLSFYRPEPLEEDLWVLTVRAKSEADRWLEDPTANFRDDFKEAVIVTATRGTQVMQFSVFNRIDEIEDRTVDAPNLRRLLEFASTGRAKAQRIIEPPIGPNSQVVQVR